MAVAQPTLTAVNNEDGTATFTVSGSTAGSTNEIRITTMQQPLAWVLLGSRVGDGVVNVTLNPGFFWCAAFSSLAGDANVSLPIGAIFTQSATAIFEQIIVAVIAKLQAAADAGSFGDLDNTRIQRINVINDLWTERLSCGLPCIIVTPGSLESLSGETNASTDIIYPVYIAVYDAKQDIEESNDSEYFHWREHIRQLFHDKHLVGLDRSVKGEWQPLQILDHKSSEENMFGFASSCQVLFTIRELDWS